MNTGSKIFRQPENHFGVQFRDLNKRVFWMKYLSLYITAVVAMILDQISKWAILAKFEDFERVNIIPHFLI